jgi:death-on-curing protein
VHRPQTTVGGADAYPDVHSKAAALFHSLIRNHAFIDGNKRTALGPWWFFTD